MSTITPYQSLVGEIEIQKVGEKLPFCTPLLTNPPNERPASQCAVLNIAENYFNWGDTFALLPRQEPNATISNEVTLIKFPRYSSKAQEIFCKILLVLSYITAIVPLIMLIAKAIFRIGTQNYIITAYEDKTAPQQDMNRTEESHNEENLEQNMTLNAPRGSNQPIQKGNNAPINPSIDGFNEVKGWLTQRGKNPLMNCRSWPAERCWDLLMGIAQLMEEQSFANEPGSRSRDFLAFATAQLLESLNRHVIDRGPPNAHVHPDVRATWTEERKVDRLITGPLAANKPGPTIAALRPLVQDHPVFDRIYDAN